MLIEVILIAKVFEKKYALYTAIFLNKANLNDYLTHILLFFYKKCSCNVLHTHADQTSVLPTAKFRYFE